MTWRVRDFLLAMGGGVLLAALVALLVPPSSQFFLVALAVAQYAGHLVVLGLLARRRGGIASLGFQVEGKDGIWLFLGIVLQLTLPILFFPLADLVSDGEGGQVIGEELAQLQGTAVRVTMAATIGLFAPVIEELMFRGILLRALHSRGVGFAIGASAVVFALFHIFGLSGDLGRALIMTMPPFLIMGVILALITTRSQRLGPAIFIHAGFNLLGLFVLLLPEEVLEEALRQMTTTTSG